ncbi:MAG: adenine phosphoribosyltransferase [Gordonia sp. (in: high G+C Gram-positive bacteria)]|uniref:adenine phosphoribosyltransferase n=1 Tax=Gordonia sp. (in: high G+C Gram-positive bacteria) TaxID=84139 RepID=UPI0039E385A8
MSLARAREAIAALTRTTDDFPVAGVTFRDLTPVLADADGYAAVIEALAATVGPVDLVAGIDARGFLLGGGVAQRLGTGVLAIRKQGKLPPPVRSRSYDLEYGTAALEIPADAPDLTGRRVLILDDVLATGGTIVAAVDLLRAAGAEIVGVGVVLELADLGGRARVDRHLPAGALINALATG